MITLESGIGLEDETDGVTISLGARDADPALDHHAHELAVSTPNELLATGEDDPARPIAGDTPTPVHVTALSQMNARGAEEDWRETKNPDA